MSTPQPWQYPPHYAYPPPPARRSFAGSAGALVGYHLVGTVCVFFIAWMLAIVGMIGFALFAGFIYPEAADGKDLDPEAFAARATGWWFLSVLATSVAALALLRLGEGFARMHPALQGLLAWLAGAGTCLLLVVAYLAIRAS